MKIINFGGDLTDNSAKKEALIIIINTKSLYQSIQKILYLISETKSLVCMHCCSSDAKQRSRRPDTPVQSPQKLFIIII